MYRVKSELSIHLIFVLLLIFFDNRASSNGRFQGELYKNLCDAGIYNWKNRETCKYVMPQTSRQGKVPYRIWEGKGNLRFLGGRNAELSCDFQQPRSIISNVIWHKLSKPKFSNYNEDEKRVLYRPINNGVLFRPYNHERIYALNRPGGSSLFIQDMNHKDFGVYRCLASRYAIPSFSPYPEILTVYKDIEFYPKYLDYEVFE